MNTNVNDKIVDTTNNAPAIQTPTADLSTNILTMDLLEAVIDKRDLITARNARNQLNGAGLNADALNDTQAILIAINRKKLKSIDDKTREIALSAGIESATEVWKAIDTGKGKAFNSLDAYFKAYYPEWNHTTMHNYAAVGRMVYLPVKLNRKVEPEIKLLANLSPSVVQYALKALSSPDSRKKLCAAIREGRKNGDKLTQRNIKAYNKSACADDVVKDANTESNSEANNPAPSDFLAGGLKELIDRYVILSTSRDDEVNCLFSEFDEGNWGAVLSKASKDKEYAFEFCKIFYRKYMIEAKLYKSKNIAPDEIAD